MAPLYSVTYDVGRRTIFHNHRKPSIKPAPACILF